MRSDGNNSHGDAGDDDDNDVMAMSITVTLNLGPCQLSASSEQDSLMLRWRLGLQVRVV